MALVFVLTIASLFVSAPSSLAMPVMVISLLLGSTIGLLVTGLVKFRDLPGAMLPGIRMTGAGIIVMILIIGLKTIIENGNVMDTLLYYAYQGVQGTSPVAALFIILAITMAMEFLVGSASAKAYRNGRGKAHCVIRR